MALGTIRKVYTRDGRKPGAVVFTDGKKYSTFDDALITGAMNGIGLLAEYTTEQNGQYVNLKTLVPKGPAPAAQPSEPARGTDLYFSPPLAWAIHDLAAAVRELTSWVGRKPSLDAVQSGQAPVVVPEPEQPAVDPIADMQDRLGKAIHIPEAADAMFAALRAKHKSPEKLLAAATDLLKAHGVDDSNSDELPF